MEDKTLVRPRLEYAAFIWDPCQDSNISVIESVQNRTVHFLFCNYHRTSSVTSMKATLSLSNLALHREIFSLCLFYKIYYPSPVLKDTFVSPPHYTSYRRYHQHKVGVSKSHTKSFL